LLSHCLLLHSCVIAPFVYKRLIKAFLV